MAERIVTGTAKSRAGAVSELCCPQATWSPRSTHDAITDIRDGVHSYLTEADGSRAQVVVVEGAYGPYLRTRGDPSAENNLQSLPRCANAPAPGPDHWPTSHTAVDDVRERRNIAEVPAEERRRLRDAIIGASRRFYPGDDVSWWAKQDQIHQATHVHQGPAFLPWHRELVNRFEALLREVDPRVTLHYWDWQTDPRAGRNGRGGVTDLFTNEFLGPSQGVPSAPFVFLDRVTRAVAGGTPRDFTFDDGAGNLVHGDVGSDEDAIWLDDYPAMRLVLERVHGFAHAYLGGTIGDPHTSFRDPWVFLLHSNLDRLFASWQLRARGDSRLALPGLDPAIVYGAERDIEHFRNAEGSIVDGCPLPMQPWADKLHTGVWPWGPGPRPNPPGPDRPNRPEARTCLDPAVVRPPLYDRYTFPIGASWNGMLLQRRLPDGDVIAARIEPNAVGHDIVEFVLEAAPGITWWKGIRIPDGEGNSWMIETQDASTTASVTLWAQQVHNGQELIFHKAKFAGGHRIVYRLGDLGRLAPGSRVTFRWRAD